LAAAIGLLNLGFESPAREVFKDQELLVASGLQSVNCGNVWMIERRQRVRFLQKALDIDARRLDLNRQKLQCNAPVQFLVERFVDNAHSARAELRVDLVVKNLLDAWRGYSTDLRCRLAAAVIARGRGSARSAESRKGSGKATVPHGKVPQVSV